MNELKIALLGFAVLAAASIAASADQLSDLKAQIEALNPRVVKLEKNRAGPAGLHLLTQGKAAQIVIPSLDVDRSYGATANQINILPSADMPASTVIQWSGYVKTGLIYEKTFKP
jgi:hypothetical protein